MTLYSKIVVWWWACKCRSFPNPHDPERHKELKCEYDWRTPEQRNIEYWAP